MLSSLWEEAPFSSLLNLPVPPVPLVTLLLSPDAIWLKLHPLDLVPYLLKKYL